MDNSTNSYLSPDLSSNMSSDLSSENDVHTDDNRSTMDYLWMISMVLKDKLWFMMSEQFDAFEKVERIYPETSYYRNYTELLGDANHIIDNIYLGSAYNAADLKWLKANGIDVVINATRSISHFYPDQYTYYRYEVDDLEHQSLGKFYEHFCELIADNSDKKILVHCYAGRSRSASLVLYYLVRNHGMTVDEALDYLKEKRPTVNLNRRFVSEIRRACCDASKPACAAASP